MTPPKRKVHPKWSPGARDFIGAEHFSDEDEDIDFISPSSAPQVPEPVDRNGRPLHFTTEHNNWLDDTLGFRRGETLRILQSSPEVIAASENALIDRHAAARANSRPGAFGSGLSLRPGERAGNTPLPPNVPGQTGAIDLEGTGSTTPSGLGSTGRRTTPMPYGPGPLRAMNPDPPSTDRRPRDIFEEPTGPRSMFEEPNEASTGWSAQPERASPWSGGQRVLPSFFDPNPSPPDPMTQAFMAESASEFARNLFRPFEPAPALGENAPPRGWEPVDGTDVSPTHRPPRRPRPVAPRHRRGRSEPYPAVDSSVLSQGDASGWPTRSSSLNWREKSPFSKFGKGPKKSRYM